MCNRKFPCARVPQPTLCFVLLDILVYVMMNRLKLWHRRRDVVFAAFSSSSYIYYGPSHAVVWARTNFEFWVERWWLHYILCVCVCVTYVWVFVHAQSSLISTLWVVCVCYIYKFIEIDSTKLKLLDDDAK